ncbi:hypothetical protein [Cryobacterium sp. TMT2-10]|uniref:hypothetical protein n=1 Tax=Cryobacterium sp. TMT2-10 TaxID=1259244 RepID=UPI001A7E15A0|nr:hypothetical protein [Cryobacterium sp. TMT2-10]
MFQPAPAATTCATTLGAQRMPRRSAPAGAATLGASGCPAGAETLPRRASVAHPSS